MVQCDECSLVNAITYYISFSKTMDQSVVFGGMLFSKLLTVLLDRLQTEKHLAYHTSKNKQGIASDLLFGEDYDQNIEGKIYFCRRSETKYLICYISDSQFISSLEFHMLKSRDHLYFFGSTGVCVNYGSTKF